MEVFQTYGLPPSSGSTSLATIGWTMNTRPALANTVTANSTGEIGATGLATASVEVIGQVWP